MCKVSMVGDHYHQQWAGNQQLGGQAFSGCPGQSMAAAPLPDPRYASKEDMDRLRLEVLEMREFLIKAKAYDESTGQADCEREDKVKVLRQVAALVGVDLSEVFPKAPKSVPEAPETGGKEGQKVQK